MNNVQELWKAILSEIETEVSKANFLTLFKKTSLLSFEEGVATISAPSTMIIDLLQKRFYQIIKKTIDKHTGTEAKVIFVPRAGIMENSGPSKSGPLFEEYEKPALPIGHLPRVRKDYTFQTLAVSSSNQLAYVSAQTVVKKIGEAYNPLFIYGPTGVGKTHLMHAMANQVYETSPNRKIIYLTSEDFTNEVVEAIRTNDTARMKKKLRTVDLLMLDDVQFIVGKERIQEELFHTFNTLVDKGSQIVLSSDRPPSDIKNIEKRLSSRFAGGLTVDIEPPDFELRTAILLIKAKKIDFNLPIETAKKIAEKTLDTRSLEGNLLRIMTEYQARGEPMEIIAEKILNNGEEEIKHYHPDEFIKNLCDFYKIKPTQIKSPRRNASLVRVRQIAMYLLRKEFGLSFVEIGNILGGRDHTTVIYGVDKVENNLTRGGLSGEITRIINFNRGHPVD